MRKVCKYVVNLRVEGMKAPLRHVKGITPGMHGAPEKVRLSFHTSESSQGSVQNMVLQDTVELRRSPDPCRAQPVDQPCLKIPALPAGSLQSTQRISWAASGPAQGWVCSPIDVFQPF